MKRGYTLVELLVGMVLVATLTGVILLFATSGVKLWRLGASKVDTNEAALLTLHTFQSYLQGSHIQSVYINPSGVAAGISYLSAYDAAGVLQYKVSSPTATPPPVCSLPTCGPCCPLVTCSPGGGCGPAPPSPCPPGACPCPSPVSTPPCLPYAQDGYVIWQKFQILYYDPATRTIRLGEVGLPTPSIAPVPYRLTAYTPKATDHIISGHIESLTVSSKPLDLAPCPCVCPSLCPAGGLGTPAPLTQTPNLNPVYVEVKASNPAANDNNYSTTLSSAIFVENGFNTGGNIGESVCCGPVCPVPCP